MNKPTFAVVGTGRMAASMMSTIARAGLHVAAVVSRDLARSQAFARMFNIENAYADLGALSNDGRIDAVYIANEPTEHARTAIAAMEAGKAVLCEKPLAITWQQADRIRRTADRTGMLCMEGIWTLFLPAYRRFLELAKAQPCGRPRHLTAGFGYPVGLDSRLLSPAAGGVLLDRGIYLVALALTVLGPVEKISGTLELGAHGVEHQASLLLEHRDGAQSQLSASFTAFMSNTASLACTAGAIRLEEPLIGSETVSTRHVRTDAQLPQSIGSYKDSLGRMLRENASLRRLKRALPAGRTEHYSYGSDRHLPQLEHFIELLGSKKRESDIIPLKLSLEVLEAIEQIRSS